MIEIQELIEEIKRKYAPRFIYALEIKDNKIENNEQLDIDIKKLELDIESPQIRVGKKGLKDSKSRGIRTRYTLPFTINSIRYLLVLEDAKYDAFKGQEKSIFKCIYDFKNRIEK